MRIVRGKEKSQAQKLMLDCRKSRFATKKTELKVRPEGRPGGALCFVLRGPPAGPASDSWTQNVHAGIP